MQNSNIKNALIPSLFIILWSTAFIAAKYCVQYSEPYTLIFLRGLGSLIAFGFLIIWFKAKFPTKDIFLHQLIIGVFLHGIFLGGCFYALQRGLPTGIVAIITGCQPMLTALYMSFFEKSLLPTSKWVGIFLGMFGVGLIVSPNSSINFDFVALISVILGLLGITIGTIYQKKIRAEGHLLTTTFIQYISMTILMGVMSVVFEPSSVQWNTVFVLGLVWLVLGISVTAILLYMYMIKNGDITKAVSYFYIVPVLTAFQGWMIFGESITPIMLIGMVVTIAGLFLILRNH